jgi:hypothetical protein
VESGAVYSELALKADSVKAYQTDDTTETTLASDDIIPFYDTSATAKRKMTVQKFGEQLISNPNLLDNPWFTVNQRGLSNFVNNSYGVDRWKFVSNQSPTISFTNNGIEISDYVDGNIVIAQRFESELLDTSKDYTLSIMASDGSILSSKLDTTGSLSYMGQLAGANIFQKIALLSGIPELELYVNGLTTDLTIRAVKIELGSVSTLAMDTAPNYATELLKCQRYFIRLAPTDNYSYYDMQWALDTTVTYGVLTLPTSMRAKPTLTLSDASKMELAEFTSGGLVQKAITSLSLGGGLVGNKLSIVISATGLTKGSMYWLRNTNATDVYIDLSADL